MTMTSTARSRLSKTIRQLRGQLLTDLQEAAEREYQFDLEATRLPRATAVRRRRLSDHLQQQARMGQADAEPSADASPATESLTHASPTDAPLDTSCPAWQAVLLEAAYTLLNRLVILRIAEAVKLRRLAVVTGGWNSGGYREFRELAPALVQSDDSEAFLFVLQLVFDDLAVDLPGLYGDVGTAALIPIPTATLKAVLAALDDPELASCWDDDMTLGWVYQYWNDPQREALDAKIKDGGKIEPHEIASKTQMFTERYMVDWLLQNCLGPMWLAMCQKHGWTPAAVADGTLDSLEQRRVQWRQQRDDGTVSLTDLMPLHSDRERRWAYYVPQPISQEAVEHAADSVRQWKILDPAVGSGHFLVVAFDLLWAMYQEEAACRNQTLDEFLPDQPGDSPQAKLANSILENNLHGIDLDPRAVQIAAAAVWLKAQQMATGAAPRHLNLVASNLGLAQLPEDDAALVQLRQVVADETGILEDLTNGIVRALQGADHLGSLLKVDAAIGQAIDDLQTSLGIEHQADRVLLAPDGTQTITSGGLDRDATKAGLLQALEDFLQRHTRSDELGLRLSGEQLAAGVRFVRLLQEGTYDAVVGNPPYLGSGRIQESSYVNEHYTLGKADLYAAFLLRGLELARPHGVSGLLTMRNWMFIKQYAKLRMQLLEQHALACLGDFDRGAFESIAAGPGGVSVAASIFLVRQSNATSLAIRPSAIGSVEHDFPEKRAATLCHVGRHEFEPAALKVVPEWPLVYWWDNRLLCLYGNGALIGDQTRARQGLITSDDQRFIRFPFELGGVAENFTRYSGSRWYPVVQGGGGTAWIEPLSYVVRWSNVGLEVSTCERNGRQASRTQNVEFYFRSGVAFSPIGSQFAARVHRFPSVFTSSGSTIVPCLAASIVCVLNSSLARIILESLNPTVHFNIGDVERLPAFRISDSERILAACNQCFSVHEAHREPSVEFQSPGPSPWRHAQDWAQLAVDRPEGDPLPPYTEQLDSEPPTDHLSFGVGVALGRFHATGGIVDPQADDLSDALPGGMLFLDGSLPDEDLSDSLGHAATGVLHDKWEQYGEHVDGSLRTWLRTDFFKDVHLKMYENRPIHWPLTSAKKTFVAWVTIHRWEARTLNLLLADHLLPRLKRLQGEQSDLQAARNSTDRRAVRQAEKRYDQITAWCEELSAFVELVRQCADKGPPPVKPHTTERETDARYAPDLDDGVMINSAALWPLLEPVWKQPKTWWQQMAAAKGKKDFDWAHLARRYWPDRVDGKCQKDPSLAVAHGCFWKYHPDKAWAWELRLQYEIEPDFRLTERPYGDETEQTGGDTIHRASYLQQHPDEAIAAIEKEGLRRLKKIKAALKDAAQKAGDRGDDGAEPTDQADKQAEPLPETLSHLALLDAGLWTSRAEACRAVERKITAKQQAPFFLLAPDAPADAQASRRSELLFDN
ncbi:MAG: BREX-6 system adenine-specific DNA-methyltransferase PglX [Planctomycetaceae bacterium]|nr:BREX-6 system adenine-specific DNA-methyltransferase PglX [Planctomycetaceae bacterium]